MNRKIASVALTAALVGGVGGIAMGTPMAAFAADASSPAAAEATARTPGQWARDALKGLVDNGTLTQAQSDSVVTALEQARPKDGRAGHGRGGHAFFSRTAAAQALGMTEDELHTAQHEGKSIATIASERKVELQGVIDAIVAAENVRIDEGVTAGRLTQAQADTLKANTVARVTDMVNRTRPPKGERGERRGFGGGAPGNTSSTTAAV